MRSPAQRREDDEKSVVALDDPLAADLHTVGAKAAALARAANAGLPVVPGFAISPAAALSVSADEDAAIAREIRRAWLDLTDGGRTPVVVRSSSAHEDGEISSMAGRFDSVLDVRDWDEVVDAIRAVVASGHAAVEEGVLPSACMAVLVQRHVDPSVGGIMFGADPVTGRADRLAVAAVPGGPHELVSGTVDGAQLTLKRSGRLVDAEPDATSLVGASLRRRLARLARQVRAVFGGPQDVEWGLVDDELVLLQSRPITAAAASASGPVLGPGPVAETFPEPLSTLEADLWVEPLRDGIREALRLSGSVRASRLARSPVVVTIGGRVAADLELFGIADERRTRTRSFLAILDPRPSVRRVGAAWRVGRLRASLPALAGDLVVEVDRRLAAVPPLDELEPPELLEILRRVRRALVAVHGHEVLAGVLLDDEEESATAASVALRVLAERPADLTDDELVARYPVLLALTPPRIGPRPELPRIPARTNGNALPRADDATPREALRLRARWLHELSARAALALGARLAADHRIATADSVRELTLERVEGLVSGRVGLDLGGKRLEQSPPLPARFRLTPEGEVVPVADGTADGARGAGGGRGAGVVVAPDELPQDGAVLVVRTLDPALASRLPGLAGLVSETGSALSHLAILARELSVPTAVGVHDAVERFPPGTALLVDGTTGAVTPLDESVARAEEIATASPNEEARS
jgi:pyruvate,water dikinase